MLDRDKWRIPLIKEVMDMKYGNTTPHESWTQEKFDVILEFACTDKLPPSMVLVLSLTEQVFRK